MSTGLECQFVETKDGKHYFMLENACGMDPDEDGDYARDPVMDTYGPFTSFDLAKKALDDNFANPGGYSTGVLTEDPDPYTAAAIASATIPGHPLPRYNMRMW